MKDFEKMTLGEIVSANYKTAGVFDRFGLDFCCNGQRTIEQACREKDIDPHTVIESLQALGDDRGDEADFNEWPLDALTDHIQTRHHSYVEEKSPALNRYLEKIANVHGNRHPELFRIQEIFKEIAGELAVHLKKEELMVFPYIKKLEKARAGGQAVNSPVFTTLRSPVRQLMADHADEGEKMEAIVQLSSGFTAPEDACNTYRVAFQLLAEFRDDLHRHIHLENNILFPRAIQLEEVLNAPISEK